MDRIGGFDPRVGIMPLSDGRVEIGRGNLPDAQRLLPGEAAPATGGIYGKMTDSALLERFGSYLSADLRHRELLSPDVFFSTLESAAQDLNEQAVREGRQDGPLADAVRALAEVLSDRTLCEALRSLIIKA